VPSISATSFSTYPAILSAEATPEAKLQKLHFALQNGTEIYTPIGVDKAIPPFFHASNWKQQSSHPPHPASRHRIQSRHPIEWN
jgi:hypothetical protein